MSNNEKHQNQPDEIGICLKSKDWTVQWQNEQCIDTCGLRCGNVCDDNCRKLSVAENSEAEIGARVFREEIIRDTILDIVVCQSESEILSILCPAASRINLRMQHYSSKGFSRREQEIAKLRDSGLKNSEICRLLNISISTLKTHLARIKLKLES